MKSGLALLVVAGVANAALATTTVSIQTSINGGGFESHQAVAAGNVVRARVLVQTDLSSAVGLSGATYNISVSNFGS